MRAPLSTKILLAVSGCVLALSALNMVAVTVLARQQIRDLVRSDVRATGNTLAQVITARSASLTQQVHLLASFPKLHGYIQLGDIPTLADIASDYAGQMKASGVVLTDRDGKVLSDTTGVFPTGSDESADPGINDALNGDDWNGIVAHKHQLLIAVTVPISIGPAVWGTMTAYSPLDSGLAVALSRSVSGSQIAFIDHGKVVGSSVPITNRFSLPRSTPTVVSVNQKDYFALYAPFAPGMSDGQIGFVVLRPYGMAMAGYAKFRDTFLAISACFMLIALAIGSLFARSITRPLAAVMQAAETVKSGAWPEPFAVYSDDEIGMLQSVFDEMTSSVRLAQERLIALIDTDPLTGLDNHRRFQERLIQETVRAKESSERLSLMIVAFDGFAQFNQKHGHLAGDDALQAFADRLKAALPPLAVPSRYGGDEFAILLSRQSVDEAQALAERIRSLVLEIQIRGTDQLTCSIGCAEFGIHSSQPEGLALAAQLAMQQAKQLGRNRVCHFDSVPGADSAVDPYQLYEFYRDGSLSTIQTLAAAVDAKDPYTNGHSQRVAEYASGLAVHLGLSKSDVSRIHTTGTLHDVGKIGVPDAILSKPGPLTAAERAIMETHPVLGEEIVRKAPQLSATLPGVRHHHERWDGAGYPDRLAGESIPLDARILALADTFDAMTSDRPYRRGMSVEIALTAIAKGAGSQFDPALADPFIEMMNERFPQSLAA